MRSFVLKVVCSNLPSLFFQSALDAIVRFVVGRSLEVKVAGRYAGVLVKSLVSVRPKETLDTIMPRLQRTLNALIGGEEVATETPLDDAVLFHLLLLKMCVFTSDVDALEPHLPAIESILEKSVHFIDKDAQSYDALPPLGSTIPAGVKEII
ncbi:unnamed protein product [Cyprideis torosa]|uniref:Uncharacterized protein n=1 Tax=Cyprideis torosa TaxID=163714 RepID=A0A7R8WSE7_9CRUS|nr:unnamed protein product [Cyprideis torosa]CAG0904748.1 unnamed protein product [Cyprideis torosa]